VLPATDDPQRVLTDSSVLVVPSLVEGFPLSLLEGMACGLAVVSADASAGVRELIDDGVNGLLAIRGDAADLARQLGRVLADAELRRALGAAARATATLYRLDAVLDAWEQLLGGVTAR
jgi:glycosyltransferase involved in cell wall biosynthesis